MTLYRRNWDCAVCGEPVYWDSDARKLSCGCGVYPASFVNLSQFKEMPKYDRKYWKSETFSIDSAKFLSNEILLDGSQVLFISDRNSIIAGNEDPKLTLRWIRYPKGDKVQLCLAVSGSFHTEKIAYNKKNPQEWKERMWILLPSEVLPKIIKFLEKDPQVIASWMV